MPNEAYGLLGIYAGEKRDRRMVSVTPGVYTIGALGQRSGLKNTVTSIQTPSLTTSEPTEKRRLTSAGNRPPLRMGRCHTSEGTSRWYR